MRLGEVVLENERQGKNLKNEQLVRLKLKELVFAYPNEVAEVLQKTGVNLTAKLPAMVLHAIVIKNVHKNSTLRDAISKMILEMDGYLRADGQWAGIIGGALSAVGSVLTGIGRGQFQNTDGQIQLQQQQMQMEAQRREEEAKRRRNGWLIFGIALVAIAGIILTVRMIQKGKAKEAANIKLQTA